MKMLQCEGHVVTFERESKEKGVMIITEQYHPNDIKHSKRSGIKDAIAYMSELIKLGYVSAN